ncbi:immunoglobulin-like domain-containing protein [Caldalkalibacillus salinus]|uniref:immunoglobulin-like domain-containing protein n=1 Tax=Caldalkalibacillus salinus TaxID=2803787 RepID=UPI001924AA00|nr:immunoglobulin-like domain-containing protein [Caldalkalibacillus salinus]
MDKSNYTLSDSITYTITNNTDIEYYVISNEITLEKKVNNTWKKVIFNIIPIEDGQEIDKVTKENPFYSETRPLDEWLTVGTFRIVRIISKDRDINTEDIILLSSEFTIK